MSRPKLIHRSAFGSRVYEWGEFQLYLVRHHQGGPLKKVTLRARKRLIEVTL